MAFTPPNVFASNTTLTSAALEGNFEALRVYLHGGIISGDFEAAKWIQTRHVQPPETQPYPGLQHGVTGWQGGQWAGGVNLRLTFATKFLTGAGRQDSFTFIPVPNTAFSVDIRRSAKILFHYWWECESGPDNSTAAYQASREDRYVWFSPYISNVQDAYNQRYKAQECVNANSPTGFDATFPAGAFAPYPAGSNNGYAAKQGCMMFDYTGVGTFTCGLASHSAIDRVGVVNWGVALEIYYL